MTDEKILRKHNQLVLKIERIKNNSSSKTEKIITFLMTVLVYCWILYYFSTVDINPLTIIGFIAVFFLLWLLMYIASVFIYGITMALKKQEKLEHKLDNYKKLISQRVAPHNVYYQFAISFPVIKENDRYYDEDNGNVFFLAADEGKPERIVLQDTNITIKPAPSIDDPAEYRIYAKIVQSGIFQDVVIGTYRELIVPSQKKIGF
ncbi:hypothetical protein [Bacillus benzoevorans]|uniref:ABC-type multidrug transport system fused ATPase/permease subunit n=1 Tax=Bacillus benzoevorans TaxID=1456 RepID=A0A7X0LTL6_9BACI|nr:hypothetical protein [Bacillus benzoevorans]MBB6444026.1 ABC-type multidrug transport system fused ATPase/permease subunit [Bacillus benzoevorans]